MHLAKYKRSSVASLIAHDERTIENHTNEKIDPSRSHLNYSLIERGYDYYTQRLSEVFCINRKDINTIGSLVVTLPKEVHKEDERKFFTKSFEYFSNQFGEKNVVSAEVHCDETTNHLHFKFIPIYLQEKEIKRGKDKGKKIQREAVSFDEVCPRAFFKSLHKDFQTYIDKELGYHVGILNGATKGVETVEMLKEADDLEKNNQKLAEENDKLKEEIENQKKEIEQQKVTIQNQEQAISKQKEIMQQIETEYNKLIERYNALVSKINELIDSIKPLERLKSVLNTLWTFPKEFMSMADELSNEYDLDDDQLRDLDEFYLTAKENDQTLDDVISLAEEISAGTDNVTFSKIKNEFFEK